VNDVVRKRFSPLLPPSVGQPRRYSARRSSAVCSIRRTTVGALSLVTRVTGKGAATSHAITLRVTSEAECNVGWLLFVLRARRTHDSHEGRKRPHRIAGGSGQPDEALRLSVRARLAEGRLFRASGVSVARRGSGRPCNVCSQPIARDTMERELEGPRDSYGLAHEECYKLWRDESRRAQTSPGG